jgi:hypothetical protein
MDGVWVFPLTQESNKCSGVCSPSSIDRTSNLCWSVRRSFCSLSGSNILGSIAGSPQALSQNLQLLIGSLLCSRGSRCVHDFQLSGAKKPCFLLCPSPPSLAHGILLMGEKVSDSRKYNFAVAWVSQPTLWSRRATRLVPCDVRYGSKADIPQTQFLCPLSANNGHRLQLALLLGAYPGPIGRSGQGSLSP